MRPMAETAIQSLREPAFRRILCGVDDSRPSAEAARQATVLADSGGSVEFVAVCWTVGEGPRAVSMLNRERAGRALTDAERAAMRSGASASARIIDARDPAQALLDEAAAFELVAVGTHTGSRASGIILGSTASTLIHKAAQPVLVARHPSAAAVFPGRILVASDGSPGSGIAARLAGRIAAVSRSDVTVVHVSDGETPTMRAELARQTAELTEMTDREPVFAEASGDAASGIVRVTEQLNAGLVVIGSRGLGGIKALGSVSERVAHRAPCSVLVARGSP